jgi:hypothetical protein
VHPAVVQHPSKEVLSGILGRQPLGGGGELIEDVGDRLDAETRAVGDGEVAILENERVGDVTRVIAV